MSYKVIHYFVDLQDLNHPYKVGDIFPRLGLKVSEERLKELSGKNNKQGKPLIEKIEEVKKNDFSKKIEKQYNKTVINRMSTAELKELAKENGIDDSMSGSDLKKVLIDKFGF